MSLRISEPAPDLKHPKELRTSAIVCHCSI